MTLPWSTKPLADLCGMFVDGDWIESKDQSSEGIRLVQTGNVGEGTFKDRAEKARYISENTFQRLRCTEIFQGDCLISRLPDPVGRSCIIPETGERMITAVDCTVVRFKSDSCHPAFFNYYSQSGEYLSSVAELCTGTTRNRISRSNLGRIPVPVPPIAEQKRIVAILDEAFDGIATSKADFVKCIELLKELFVNATRRVFADQAERFDQVYLGDVCEFENGDRGKNYPGKQHRVSAGIPFINAGHLAEDGIDFSDMDYISPERFSLLGNGKVRANDVLFCLRGSLGKFSSVGSLNQGAIASSLVILRPKLGLNHEYLLAYLSSAQCAGQIDELKGGAAQPNLGAKDLKRFKLPLPPVSVQGDISSRLSELRDATRSCLEKYLAKISAIDDLKKSLLHHGFSGQL